MQSLSRLRERVPRETAEVVGLVSGSQFFNHAYLVLFPPILTTLAAEFDVSLTLLGLALGVQGATNAAFQLPFGWLADARDRTVAFALSSTLGALGVLLTAAAPDFRTFVAGQALVGLGVAGHHPAHYPLISDSTPESLRGRAFSVYGVGGTLGFATPPALLTAMLAVPRFSWRHAVGLVGIAGLTYALVGTLVLARRVAGTVTEPNVDPPGRSRSGVEAGSLRASLRGLVRRAQAGLRTLVASPGILGLTLLALLTSTASWGVTTYAVVFLSGPTYGVGDDLASLTLTGMFALGAVAIVAGGDLTDRIGPGPVMTWAFALVTVLVALAATGVVPGLVAVVAFLGVGAARSLAGPARDGLTDRLSAADAVGTNFAVVSVGVMVGSAVAPPLFGYLTDTAGPQVAFAVVAAVSLAGTVVAWWLARTVG